MSCRPRLATNSMGDLGPVPHSLSHHLLGTYYVPGPEWGTGVPVVSKSGPSGTICLVDNKTS